MSGKKTSVAVFFGGVSPEHEVSIISGVQVVNTLSPEKYNVYPIYVTKSGEWFLGDKTYFDISTFKNQTKAVTGKAKVSIVPSDGKYEFVASKKIGPVEKKRKLDVDVIFPAFHGKYGEDGAFQGLAEMANIAYVGCDVASSAVGMDKVLSKEIARSTKVPVMPDVVLTKAVWKSKKKSKLTEIKEKLDFPVFVKPARLGSSIGINKAKNVDQLESSIDVAFAYDTKVLVEASLEGCSEVNISLLGNDPYKTSVCEMPVSSGDILSFEDKYISANGPSKGMATLQRIIPAPISKDMQKKIEKYAKMFFSAIGGTGIARVDFLVSKNKKDIYLNEINTLPGSFSFYLWKENDIKFDRLVDELIELGLAKYKEKSRLTSIFTSNILEGFDKGSGVKGVKA